MIELGEPSRPSRFDNGRRIGLANERGAIDPVARPHIGTVVNRCDMLDSAGPHRDTANCVEPTVLAPGNTGFADRLAGGDGLDADRFDDYLPAGRGETETSAMSLSEYRQYVVRSAVRYDQRGVGADVAQMQDTNEFDARRIGALCGEGLSDFVREPVARHLNHWHMIRFERQFDRL